VNTAADGRPLRLGITVLLVLLILVGVAAVLAPLRQPLCWAAVLAFLLQPLQQRLSLRLGNRPALAAGILTTLAPLVLLLPLLLLGMAFAQQASNLVAALQANPDLWNASAWQDPLKHPHLAQSMMWLEAHLGLSAAEVYTQAGSVMQTAGKLLAGASGQFVLGAAGTLLQFFLMVFILYFLLCDGAGPVRRVARLLPLSTERRDALLDQVARVTRAVVFGTGVTAIGQGLLVGIGFALVGLPSAVVFGVMATLLALLPFAGASLVWLPAVGWLLFNNQVGAAVFLLAWGGALSTADNFVRPALISHHTPVSTLLVFLGVLGGMTAFGLVGFIIGPVLLVLATELLRFAEVTSSPQP
jgi:predicted PurR-regulated permease PerM